MSPTVNSMTSVASCARAAPARLAHSSNILNAPRVMRTPPAPWRTSTELPRDVVVEGDAHEQHNQHDTDLLTGDLRALGQRTAFQPLDGLYDDLTTIENRDGQQVHEPQGQTDHDQEPQ